MVPKPCNIITASSGIKSDTWRLPLSLRTRGTYMDTKTNNFIRHVLYDRKKNDNKNIDNHTNNNLNDYIDTKEEMSLKNFEPNYMSFYPSLNNKKFLNQEPVWIMPNLKHNFIWENLGGKC
jgi:hypothetical protein